LFGLSVRDFACRVWTIVGVSGMEQASREELLVLVVAQARIIEEQATALA
jgi:hypothetical protein